MNNRHVIAAWPFINGTPKWSAKKLVRTARKFKMPGVELLDVEHWPLLKKHNMICAATRSHTYVRGMNNLGHHTECLAILEDSISASATAGFPNVMTFTGLADTSDEKNGSVVSASDGMKNCIAGYKQIVGMAEKAGVTLILEPLNSKVDLPRQGHPGYQGDHINYCLEIIKAVGSPSLKLLFDVYHIQIMDGDLISHIRTNAEYIGHVQMAGVPGRRYISKNQEINYRAVIRAFEEIGYSGYLGHEWLPGRNAKRELRMSIENCTI